MNTPLENPELWGVDEIVLVDDFEGRYTKMVTKPGHFVWDKPRQSEVSLPHVKWRIGGKWYGAVIEPDFDAKGREEPFSASLKLSALIEQSKTCQG